VQGASIYYKTEYGNDLFAEFKVAFYFSLFLKTNHEEECFFFIIKKIRDEKDYWIYFNNGMLV